MKLAIQFVFLMASGWAFAAPDARRDQLEAALMRVQQEQQSLYQQFQMSQEMRRIELQDNSPTITQGYPAMGADSTRALDYDENVRIQRQRQERLQAYERQLGLSYSRFIELENKKQELLQQIVELNQTPPAAKRSNSAAPVDALSPARTIEDAGPYGNTGLPR